ncbi:MAG: ABC transporter permease [Candidatus Koribacter versatilis]|uniref:ABC transporter permease n=1 Tax=Candidatus Korobacter versatilis TaxID=658062 RepID=A0A932EPZ6_9BACT|nr:ABC transporter permease [Candidatus Koribacter versatilis]
MMLRSALRDRSRSVLAMVAVVVAAGVSTALLNLYSDLDAKLHTEFRRYGANVVMSTPDGFAPETLQQVEASLPAGSVAAPFVYAVAKASDQSSVIVAATDFARAKRLDGWWSVSAWPQRPGEALVGIRARKNLSHNGAGFDLNYGGKPHHVEVAGTLQTGGDEDSRVYLSLADLMQWTSLQPNVLEIAVPGSAAEVERVAARLRAMVPGARVEPVRQIVEAEANVLGKTRGVLLGALVVVILLATMCLLATLTTSVLDRRKDFAVMRALGATRGMVHVLFLAEISMFASIGCVVGMLLGMGLSAWIGQVNFQSAVTPRWSVLPMVLAGTLLVAAIAAALPMVLLGRAQPAALLRGE